MTWIRQLAGLAEARWAAAATLAFLLGLALDLSPAPGAAAWACYAVCYATGGWEPAREGLAALRERTLDVDLLMVAAALGAAAIGQPLEGALLIVIFATSGALEAFATRRTADSVRGLLDLAPQQATRERADGGEERVAAAGLTPGDVVRVRPGERIGADGTVLDGASDVDQSSVTGEPVPVPRTAGDTVFAGTLNGRGALRVRVDREAGDSVLARIVALVEEASRTKAPGQLFVERVEQRYALGMVAATVAVFAVPLAFGAAVQETLLRAMTFMIVASPCAVVLATMPPLLAAIANAGRHGVLVKSAAVMERLGTVDRVAFDKTGTLTAGEPAVVQVRMLPGPHGAGSGGEAGRERLLALAAAAERSSEHPLGRAVAAAGAGLPALPAAGFTAVPGHGVRAEVEGVLVEVGAPHRVPGGSGPGEPAGGCEAAPDRAGDHARRPVPGDTTPDGGPTVGGAAADGPSCATPPAGAAAPAGGTVAPPGPPGGDGRAGAADSGRGTVAAGRQAPEHGGRPGGRTRAAVHAPQDVTAPDPLPAGGPAAVVAPQAGGPADGTAAPADGPLERELAELAALGLTAVVVRLDGRPAGVLGLADRPRPGAREAVARLRAQTARPPVLLTGDGPGAAARLAGACGIDRTAVRAALLPEQKVAAVRELQGEGERVLLVGDGVNDAPALAAADTGLAMGRTGADLALETADAVLVRDELHAVPAVVALSRRARRLVVQNLVIAGTAIVVLVAWDLLGTLPLPLGVAGHEGSTVLVGLNGLRLLRRGAWQTAPQSKTL
ncbi:HAD-IC family P-type ATPase [Streptomyces sp. JJ36]|uniref:HAD-IC family P-type ATPase n=1 Tax=Streptomyces sp. JJ36 TaxID=2736645 RepID=UPI001F0194D5|nr:HAD-IC family P-type ATPase [Streptomyces sp. JJ36]MCF6525518.1 HAD-IC family P-type ATPase [Streptomyces sp. JJ36]